MARRRCYERIKAITPEGDVVFSVRADERGGKRLIKLPGQEFVCRFLLHVLPAGLQRVRHYGVLANGCKKTQLAQARRALVQAPPNRPALEATRAFVQRVSRVDFLCCAWCTRAGCRRRRRRHESLGEDEKLLASATHAGRQGEVLLREPCGQSGRTVLLRQHVRPPSQVHQCEHLRTLGA